MKNACQKRKHLFLTSVVIQCCSEMQSLFSFILNKKLLLRLFTITKYHQSYSSLWCVICGIPALKVLYSFGVIRNFNWQRKNTFLFRTKLMIYIYIYQLCISCLTLFKLAYLLQSNSRSAPNTAPVFFASCPFPVNRFAIHLESFIFGDCKVAATQRKVISSLKERLTKIPLLLHITYQVIMRSGSAFAKKCISQHSEDNNMNQLGSQRYICIWRFLIGILKYVNSFIIAAFYSLLGFYMANAGFPVKHKFTYWFDLCWMLA